MAASVALAAPPGETSLVTFGERVRQLRRQKGLTLRAVAAAADMSESTLSQIENGHRSNVTIATVGRLRAALEVTAAELFEGVDDFPGEDEA